MIKTRTPVIGVCGWKKSGKTTLAVRLIEEFTRRGHHVASIKHAHESFQVDDAQTDSSRHRTAGSGEICIVGSKRWAIIHQLDHEPEPNLEEVLSWMSPADLIVVEGYKSAAIPKIEVRSQIAFSKRRLSADDPHVIAVASDKDEPNETVPVFSRDQIEKIADLVVAKVGPIGRRIARARAGAAGGTGASRPAGGPSRGSDDTRG